MLLLQTDENGLYCAAGDFYIDPWKPVDFAVITHAHSDHARPGSRHYLAAEIGRNILQERLGPDARIEPIPYGKTTTRNGVTISLHPAGHILGSAQVRVEHKGEIWVVTGDYKLEAEPTCAPFEPVRCHTLVTESTFGLPIYRWRPQAEVFEVINAWWRDNQSKNRASVLFAYSLGKAQRILAGIDPSIGPIYLHGAPAKFIPLYAEAGVKLPETLRVGDDAKSNATSKPDARAQALVIAPGSAEGTPWLRRFGEQSHAFASGWMQLRGARRRQALDRGFVLSDHADWDGLHSAIKATGAEKIYVTHGYTAQMVRWLNENGWQAEALATRFQGETATEAIEENEPAP
ncbi:MAG: ligase-associated DNA damage response exonuclease [Chthoniobacteraceae bacterium]